MSMSANIFGRGSFIFKATNILGLGIPGLLDRKFNPKQKSQAPTPGEYATQTAKEGEPRPIVFGIARPIAGNIMDTTEAIVKTEYVKVKSQGGKGGKKKKEKQAVEKVYRTYAIRVCEGPITGFRRIWRNNKLVYDGRAGSDWGARNNHVFLSLARLYTGDWNQMPDPTLESLHGVGNVPAYRGTAYIVFVNEDLTDLGGAIPQYQFEVARSEGFVLSSRPYAVDYTERLIAMNVSDIKLSPATFSVESLTASNLTLVNGSLKEYGYVKEHVSESLNSSKLTLLNGSLRGNKLSIKHNAHITTNLIKINDGSLKKILISAPNQPSENIHCAVVSLNTGELKR